MKDELFTKLKRGDKVRVASLSYFLKNFEHDDDCVYIGMIPFVIKDMKKFCGKEATISSYKTNNRGNVYEVKIKEDRGKYIWLPAMFFAIENKDLAVGDNVVYRNYKNPAKIVAIEGFKYFIEFAHAEDKFNTCNGKVPSGRGWIAHSEDLQKRETVTPKTSA